jgi:hypothetical protein
MTDEAKIEKIIKTMETLTVLVNSFCEGKKDPEIDFFKSENFNYKIIDDMMTSLKLIVYPKDGLTTKCLSCGTYGISIEECI